MKNKPACCTLTEKVNACMSEACEDCGWSTAESARRKDLRCTVGLTPDKNGLLRLRIPKKEAESV